MTAPRAPQATAGELTEGTAVVVGLVRILMMVGYGAAVELASWVDVDSAVEGDLEPEAEPRSKRARVRWIALGLAGEVKGLLERGTGALRGAPRGWDAWARAGEACELACRRSFHAAVRGGLRRMLASPLSEMVLDEATGVTIARVIDDPQTLALVDRVVLYLGEHPELQALIRAQSKDLVEDAVGEIRSHAVQADNAIDRVVSRLRGEAPAR